MRGDGGGETYGDAVDAQHQAQGDLGGQEDRLFVAPVVARDVLGDFGREELFASQLGEAALDVTPGGSFVARKDVTEVALPFDEITLVGEGYDGVLNRHVAVRMVVHGVAHHAGDLGETPVVLLPHGVQNAPLHRLETVLDGWEGAVADRVGGELQEVVVHQPAEGPSRRNGNFGVFTTASGWGNGIGGVLGFLLLRL